MITAPQLFAGILNPAGNNNCYYCGGICGNTNQTKDLVKPTFTNRDIVRFPSSEYVCDGCVTSLNEKATIKLIDGEIRENQKTRLYSWLFDSKGRQAFTKAHNELIKNILLNPPDPPFSIVFATSGQKQLLFRSVIAWDRENYNLLLEDEIVSVNVKVLKEKLNEASIIISAIGKPAIKEMDINHAVKYYEYYGNLTLFNKWKHEFSNPINRLSVYVSPNQKECQESHERITNGIDNCRAVPIQTCLFD